MKEFERIEVESAAALRAWMRKHHGQAESIWLVTFKKNSTAGKHVPFDLLLDEALCFGWVDSLPRVLDADRSMRLLSPRRPGSAWSARNKQRALALIEAGRMQASGLARVRASQADGSWSRLDDVETLTLPPDLQSALRLNKAAMTFFEAFPRSTKRAILEWIGNAKQPETRTRRIMETVDQASRNIRANQPRQLRSAGLDSGTKR